MSSVEAVATYVWPMETVSAVRGLRASVMVDNATLAKYGDDAMSSVKDKLAGMIVRLAESLAAVPHPQDCVFNISDSPGTFQTKVECAWRPGTHEVELIGGPGDGKVWSVVNVGDVLKAPIQQPMTFEPDDAEAVLSVNHVDYSLAGWSESARRWVYRP